MGIEVLACLMNRRGRIAKLGLEHVNPGKYKEKMLAHKNWNSQNEETGVQLDATESEKSGGKGKGKTYCEMYEILCAVLRSRRKFVDRGTKQGWIYSRLGY